MDRRNVVTRLRTRAVILVAAVTPALLVGGVSPATAETEQSVATKAVAGRMLVTPRREALVTRLPVRVVFRVPARTSRLWVRVGSRNITARFRRTRGSLRVARLTRGDGLRYGHNHLFVLAERTGGRPVAEARSFVLARRHPDLVRVLARTGTVTSLSVRIAAPRLAREHFGQLGAVERRLSVIRRERTVRVRLNGRRVTRALRRSQPTRWTASLSSTHGLRHGLNRLRILVAETDRGRYQLVRRSFVVRRDRHLAGAGWDTATRVGGLVRLDGRRSRTASGGRPRHRWRILSRPRGSRAKLRRASSPRPLLTPDRRGRYVIGLTVTGPTARATVAEAGPPSTDRVAVTVGPATLAVPFKGLTVKDDHPGIQVGDTFYPNPTNGTGMQWLTLDRATLLPTKRGNSWLDGTGSGDHGIQMLAGDLCTPPCPPTSKPLNRDQLVILSYPRGAPGSPVQPEQIDAFNRAMKTLGVGPIDPFILEDKNKLVIVAVPFGGDGSGKYTHGGGPVDALTGWLMPDGALNSSQALQFRLQPERPAFDTSSNHTGTTNTMTVRDQRFDATLPPGASGGFQVVTFNPIDLTPEHTAVYATNGVADPVTPLKAMAKFLNDRAQDRQHVAVQSIGQVAPTPLPHSPYEYDPGIIAWWQVGSALTAFGANPHIFNTVGIDPNTSKPVGGSYAFFGGTWLKRSEVADSSSAVVIDPTKDPPSRESGRLEGRMSMRQDGYWMPAIAHGSESFESSLYNVVLRDPTPWPYTKGGSCAPTPPPPPSLQPMRDAEQLSASETCSEPEATAYAKALADIAKKLNVGSPDLRQAYVQNPKHGWSGSKTDLALMPYPGDGYTCTDDAGRMKHDPGYTREQFCRLSNELQSEFDWLDNTKDLFDSYEDAFNRSGGKQSVDLQTIGRNIRAAVAADNSAEKVWTAGAFYGNLSAALLVLAAGPEGPFVLAAWEALVSIYELVRELVSENGTPVGDELAGTVEELESKVAQRLFDSANGLDRLHQVIISDYGRLKALGPYANDSGWRIDGPDTAEKLGNGAKAFFYSELMPIPYGVYALQGTALHQDDDPETCRDSLYGHTWRGAPATSQMQWIGAFDRDEVSKLGGRFVLGRHSLSIRYYAYPPGTLTDSMFLPTTQGGLGMQLPRFVWEQYADVPQAPPTDLAYCHGG